MAEDARTSQRAPPLETLETRSLLRLVGTPRTEADRELAHRVWEELRGRGIDSVIPLFDVEDKLSVNGPAPLSGLLRTIRTSETRQWRFDLGVRESDEEVSQKFLAGLGSEGRHADFVANSDEDLERLIEKIANAGPNHAETAAFVASGLPTAQRNRTLRVVVARFVRELDADNEYVAILGSSSAEAGYFHQWLRALSRYGVSARAELRASRTRARSARGKRWLTVALGESGDPTVTDALREIARGERLPRELRCRAIRAFADIAGEQATEFLRGFELEQVTPARLAPHHRPMTPAMCAHAALARLRRVRDKEP